MLQCHRQYPKIWQTQSVQNPAWVKHSLEHGVHEYQKSVLGMEEMFGDEKEVIHIDSYGTEQYKTNERKNTHHPSMSMEQEEV